LSGAAWPRRDAARPVLSRAAAEPRLPHAACEQPTCPCPLGPIAAIPHSYSAFPAGLGPDWPARMGPDCGVAAGQAAPGCPCAAEVLLISALCLGLDSPKSGKPAAFGQIPAVRCGGIDLGGGGALDGTSTATQPAALCRRLQQRAAHSLREHLQGGSAALDARLAARGEPRQLLWGIVKAAAAGAERREDEEPPWREGLAGDRRGVSWRTSEERVAARCHAEVSRARRQSGRCVPCVRRAGTSRLTTLWLGRTLRPPHVCQRAPFSRPTLIGLHRQCRST
jgi:hypothetical protein